MFDQSPFECRVEWGQRGAREAAERGDITVIVDVLSFSSTVVTALSKGALIYPYPPPINDQAAAYAAQVGAELLYGRAESIRLGKGASISPVSFDETHTGKKFVLCTLNGAACTWLAKQVPAVLIGSLLNASAVARAANQLQAETGAAVTVIACGEHWRDVHQNDNTLRPSLEDYLGAGAILALLKGSKSPEALVCVSAFESVKGSLQDLIWDCGSGRELREIGFAEDVRHSGRLDVYELVPTLKQGCFVHAIL